jgi:hypothetical protein
MAGQWEGSTRASRLPHNWPQLRQLVKERDGNRCTELMRDGTRCTDQGTDVDHILPGDDHSLDNLRLLCTWHHKKKSSAEGNAAHKHLTERRPKESHPGWIG